MPHVSRSLRDNESPETRPEFLEHLRSLQLGSVEVYRQWCQRHGFSRRIHKTWRERLKERTFFQRATADARLAQKKLETRNPDKVIQAIYRGQVCESDVTQGLLAEICRASERYQNCPAARDRLFELLLHVRRKSDLFTAAPVIAQFGRQPANSYVAALIALAGHWQAWIRPISQWRPRTHNLRRQFTSLVQHLLARWPVPPFMDCAWFRDEVEAAQRQQQWYLHLARGENIRTAELPLPYTKRMAHHFLQAPADFTIEAALRWGQIRALGGNERFTRAVIGTRIGVRFEHEDFWATVLNFLVQNPMLDPAQFGPIIDYVQQQRFSVAAAPVGLSQLPWTIKGRTPTSLLRQVESWHRTLTTTKQPLVDWPRSSIEPLNFVEGSLESGNRRLWTTTELLTTKALVEEGRLMCHCVATYARSCAHGQTSIWSLEVREAGASRKLLTLEVDRLSRVICQARGKRNALPSEKHLGILRRWAEQSRLALASWVQSA